MGLDKNKRPLLADDYANIRITASTAGSTGLLPRGVITLATTSTGAPVVYTLASAPKRGRRFSIMALDVASSSDGPFHINAGTDIGFDASSEDMLTLAVEGSAATFVGVSTSRWACIGSNGATFSTST